MRAVSELAASAAIGIDRNNLRSTAKSCSVFGQVAKTLWPRKTAHELAFRCKVSERAASYWLSGEYPPSAEALLAIMDEIVRG